MPLDWGGTPAFIRVAIVENIPLSGRLKLVRRDSEPFRGDDHDELAAPSVSKSERHT